MWITNVAVRRRVTMLMIVGALMILGFTRLRDAAGVLPPG
jgi:hypothetical protein